MYRLRFTRAADNDLAKIWDYIARDNPDIAKNFVDLIAGQCGDLIVTPYKGPARPDLGPGIRTLIIRKNYAVLYRVGANEIQIIRVVHTAQDISRVLKTGD